MLDFKQNGNSTWKDQNKPNKWKYDIEGDANKRRERKDIY